VLRIGLAKIAVERAEHGGGWGNGRVLSLQHSRQVDAGEEAGAEGFGVALDAGELAGKEEAAVVPGGEGGAQRGGAVEVCVPVDAAEAEELGIRQARDHGEDPLLLGNAEPGLEADEVPHPACA